MLSAAALVILVYEHPAQLSLHELTCILGDGTDEWSEHDAVRVALRQLVADGLAHQHGAFYFATHAAVRSEQLSSTAAAKRDDASQRADVTCSTGSDVITGVVSAVNRPQTSRVTASRPGCRGGTCRRASGRGKRCRSGTPATPRTGPGTGC
jgi:hypothetical protein